MQAKKKKSCQRWSRAQCMSEAMSRLSWPYFLRKENGVSSTVTSAQSVIFAAFLHTLYSLCLEPSAVDQMHSLLFVGSKKIKNNVMLPLAKRHGNFMY